MLDGTTAAKIVSLEGSYLEDARTALRARPTATTTMLHATVTHPVLK